MNAINYKSFKYPLLAISIFLLASCKTYLAPQYDSVIVTKLTETTSKTMQLFATVAIGTDKNTFLDREQIYNELIGNFETLNLLAKARPLPKNNATEKINDILALRNSTGISGDYPSAFAFNRIAQNLIKMKEKDKKSGLNSTVIQAFKGEIEIFLDQAMTYESFLKR